MDCVQYFTGASGTFTTYNYRAVGGQQLQGQNYAFCFRQEEGKIKLSCRIEVLIGLWNQKIFSAPYLSLHVLVLFHKQFFHKMRKRGSGLLHFSLVIYGR
jgi:hypothetical protein